MVAAVFVFVAMACNPNTTRPPFLPMPQALVDTVGAYRGTVLADLAGRATAEGLEFAEANARDGYIETRPFNVTTGATSGPDRRHPENVVTMRFWLDSLPDQRTRVWSEITHPIASDPSVPPRTNEVMAKPGGPGWDVFDRILTGMRTRFSG